jgi:hypothetical protein
MDDDDDDEDDDDDDRDLILDPDEIMMPASDVRQMLLLCDWGRKLEEIDGVQIAVDLDGNGFSLSETVDATTDGTAICATYTPGGLGGSTEEHTHQWTTADVGEYGMVLSNGHRWCLLVPEPWAMPMDWERAEASRRTKERSHTLAALGR